MNRITGFAVAFLLFVDVVSAQFRFSAEIPKVDSSSYYRIALLPVVNSKFHNDAADLRIYNGSKEIPYLIRRTTPYYTEQQFHKQEIVSTEYLKDSVTLIVIKPPSLQPIQQLLLVVRKADVQKEISISGSNDQKQWFVVKDRYVVIPGNTDESTTSQLALDIPPSDYSFYRIEIDDHFSKPVSVVQAGYYTSDFTSGAFEELKTNVTIADSSKDKSTWIIIKPAENVTVDEMSVEIIAPQLYRRKVNMYSLENTYLNSRGTFEWRSGTPAQIPVNVKSAVYYLQIMNDDNPPLSIEKVSCYQYKWYAIAFLEKDKNYKLLFGDSLIKNPVYDITYFQSVIPAEAPIVIPQKVEEQQMEVKPEAASSFFSSKRILWFVIIVVIGFLAFVTRKMLKNM